MRLRKRTSGRSQHMVSVTVLRCGGDALAAAMRRVVLARVGDDFLTHVWPDHITEFVARLEASSLEDTTALLVLPTDLCAQMRVLAAWWCGSRPAASSADEVAHWTTTSKDELLTTFQQQMTAVMGPMPHAGLSPQIEHARRFIDEHYAEPLTLDRLASATGRSKRYLVASFRQQTGVTIHSYLTSVRVRRAMDLIRQGEKAEAVSLLVGYRSKKNFYRHFKAAVGLTPVSYKTAVRKLAR